MGRAAQFISATDQQYYDNIYDLVTIPPGIIWNSENIYWGVGTFSFDSEAIVCPALLASVRAYMNNAIQPGDLTFTGNSLATFDFTQIRESTTVQNIILFDIETGKPLIWYDLGQSVDVSKLMIGVNAHYSGNVVVEFSTVIALQFLIDVLAINSGANPETIFKPIISGEMWTYTDVSYERARSGSELSELRYYLGKCWVCQYNWGDAQWENDEGFLTFSLNDDIPTKVVLRINVSTLSATQPFTLEVRSYNIGEALDDSDWIPCSNLGNYPLVGSMYFDSSVTLGSYDVELDLNEDLSGLMVCSDRQRLGQEPADGVYEELVFRAQLVYNPVPPQVGNVSFDIAAVISPIPS